MSTNFPKGKETSPPFGTLCAVAVTTAPAGAFAGLKVIRAGVVTSAVTDIGGRLSPTVLSTSRTYSVSLFG